MAEKEVNPGTHEALSQRVGPAPSESREQKPASGIEEVAETTEETEAE